MALTKKTIVLFPPELHRHLVRVAAARLRAGVWGAFARRKTGGVGAADQPMASGFESGPDEARISTGSEKARAVILVDSNIFMYAAGREHPHRDASVGFLANVADGAVNAAIDAEVLQEILHRYTSIKRWVDGQVVYDSARILFPQGAAGDGGGDRFARGGCSMGRVGFGRATRCTRAWSRFMG
jgi:hypothetical protein